MKIKKTTEKQILVEEMERVRAYLQTVKVGSDEHTKAIARLRELANDVSKINEQQKARIVRVVEFGGKVLLIAAGSFVAYRFEEKGTIITTDIGKGVMRNFIPKL